MPDPLGGEGGIEIITLGHPLLDDYLAFVAALARANTWLAVAYDLKVFFAAVGKEPAAVRRADVFVFLAAQRAPRRSETVVRLDDGEAGLATRTIARRLSSAAGLFAYLAAREDSGVRANPVPRGLASLIAQVQQMIPAAVSQARDQEHTWAEIGQLLNLSPATAARRYRNHP